MNTTDNNKLIAEFMELKPTKIHSNYQWNDGVFFSVVEYTEEKAKQAIYEYVKYHESFDWLIPVVEKIESIGKNDYFVHIMGNSCFITTNNPCILEKNNYDECIISSVEIFSYKEDMQPTKLECIYRVVVEFIKWHT